MRRLLAFAVLGLAAACTSPPVPPPASPPAPSAVPVGSDLCYLTVAEALAKPDLDVDRVPTPVAGSPPPFKPPYPRGVFGKGRSMEVAIEVLVDTLGKADMRTFKVVKTSHPWFATKLKATVASWTFDPAMKSGCRIPRIYKLGITSATKAAK